MTIMIWNHSHYFPKLTMMETSLPPFINFIQQLMILQRNSMEVTTVLGFNCHNNATNVMSCYYCGSTCNCARIQIVLFPGQLDDRPDGNDCNAEGEVWRSHWCSQECSPQHRQREKKVPLEDPSELDFSTANCWRICETNLIIQILVDGILPAAAQKIVVQSGSRNVAGARQSWSEQGGLRGREEPRNPNQKENPSLRRITTASRSRWVAKVSSPASPRLVGMGGHHLPCCCSDNLLFVQYPVNT